MLHYTGKNKLTGDIDRSLMTMWGQPESFADPVSLTKSLHGQAINSIDDGRVSPGVCCDRVEHLQVLAMIILGIISLTMDF